MDVSHHLIRTQLSHFPAGLERWSCQTYSGHRRALQVGDFEWHCGQASWHSNHNLSLWRAWQQDALVGLVCWPSRRKHWRHQSRGHWPGSCGRCVIASIDVLKAGSNSCRQTLPVLLWISSYRFLPHRHSSFSCVIAWILLLSHSNLSEYFQSSNVRRWETRLVLNLNFDLRMTPIRPVGRESAAMVTSKSWSLSRSRTSNPLSVRWSHQVAMIKLSGNSKIEDIFNLYFLPSQVHTGVEMRPKLSSSASTVLPGKAKSNFKLTKRSSKKLQEGSALCLPKWKVYAWPPYG